MTIVWRHMNITDIPEKGKKERDLIAASLAVSLAISLAASLLHFAALPNFGKIELNLFYPKFSLNFLKFYSVKFCLFKADICLYRIFTIGIWQGMKSNFDRIGVTEKNIKHQCRESYLKGAAIFHWLLRSCKKERGKGAVKRSCKKTRQ